MKRVGDRWQTIKDRCPEQSYSLDKWHGSISNLRQFLKGWGHNLRGEYRRKKDNLLSQIKILDAQGASGMMGGSFEQDRLRLESELVNLIEEEEIYWKQRGSEKQVLEGDANTAFFHLSANGRRRKKTILSLEHNGAVVTDQMEIRSIIYEFYKKLFGRQEKSTVSLAEEAWQKTMNTSPNLLLKKK